MDERIWLRHKESGGYFNCPAGTADTFKALGWEPAGGPPPEPDPVVAERIAHEPQTRVAPPAAGEQIDTSTTPRRGATSKEG